MRRVSHVARGAAAPPALLSHRRWFTSAAAPSSPSGDPFRASPYRTVVQLLEQEQLAGLKAAQGVFEQFKRHCSSARPAGELTGAVTAATIESFCGCYADVEPFTVLMMKVLCDARRWEDIRFLFALSLLEIRGKPSVEYFNVYLLSISLTDSFTVHEVDNVVEIMRVREVDPDIVTRLSLFLLYQRIGRPSVDLWPALRHDIHAVLEKPDALQRLPLLSLRLQHCFHVALRLHHDTELIHDLFVLLRRIDPEKLTSSALVAYLVLSVGNNAAAPRHTLEVVEMLAQRRTTPQEPGELSETAVAGEAAEHGAAVACAPVVSTSLSAPSSETSGDTEQAVTDAGGTTLVPAPASASASPSLLNEVTALRLMSKCAKWGDAESAAETRRLIERHNTVSLENLHMVYMLHLHTLACTGDVDGALDIVEDDLGKCASGALGHPDEGVDYSTPGPRPKLFLLSRRLTLLNADPVTTLLQRIADGGTPALDAAFNHLDSRVRGGRPVTHQSLNLILGVCSMIRDTHRAEQTLESFPEFEVTPNSASYALYLASLAGRPELLTTQFQSVIRSMEDLGVPVSRAVLSRMLELALGAQDHDAARWVLELHGKLECSVERLLAVRLLRQLCLNVDTEGVRRALGVLRATKSTVDPRTLSMCKAAFRKWGIVWNDSWG